MQRDADMKFLSRLSVIARLDLVEVVQSRWIYLHSLVYTVLALLLIFVGLRESQVLGFTGMGRVLLSLCNALGIILPLLALTGSVQVINRYREDGTHELLFSLPVSRFEYLLAVSAVRYVTVVLPLLILLTTLTGLTVLLDAESVPWTFVARSLAVSVSLLWCFVGVGLAVSTIVRNRSRSLVYLLLIWIGSVALMDFALLGMMLEWRLQPQSVFALAAVNPVQCSRLALLSAVEPSLTTLGPIGFFLDHRVGSDNLLWIGVAQPFLVGTLAWLAAWRSFRRGDLL